MHKEDFANSNEIFKRGHLVLSSILETYESETVLFNDKKEWILEGMEISTFRSRKLGLEWMSLLNMDKVEVSYLNHKNSIYKS